MSSARYVARIIVCVFYEECVSSGRYVARVIVLVVLRLNVPVNNFSVMSGRKSHSGCVL